MFSLEASTSPTAPTFFSKSADGGLENGSAFLSLGLSRATLTAANIRARTARKGTPYLVNINVSSWTSVRGAHQGTARYFCFHDKTVVHICDAVSKIEYT